MDLIQSLIVRHLKDPTTYAGLATILLTYLPVSATGIDATQWEKVIAFIVGAALIWIDGRTKTAQALAKCLLFVVVVGAVASLGACAPQIQAAANDQATWTVHQVVSTPWATSTTDYTRVMQPNTAAAANGNGTTVNVPQGASVNPAPTKPVAGTTLTTGTPTTAAGS